MSKWFPDVSTPEGLEQGRKAGAIGALAFAAMNLLGLLFVLWAGHLPGETVNGTAGQLSSLIGIGAELAVILFGAYRFWRGKGLIAGSIVLLLFAAEIVMKFLTGTASIVSILAYSAIGAAMINGIRSAWWRRTLGGEEDLAERFE
jgi:hypothetical protein